MTMRLFMLQPEVIFAARVNQASFTYPLAQVTFDTVTIGTGGASIEDGMTIAFGTTAGGDDLGRQRVKGAASATEVFFGRSSRGTNDGEVSLQDNAYITVWNDYRVWAKIPYIDDTGAIFKDHDIVMTDQTIDIPPKANAGPGFCGTIATGTNVITVAFNSAESFSLVSTITGYGWDVDDGTITVGTNTSANITATFPAGFRYVRFSVTDDNGKVHTTRIPVYARNPAADTTIPTFTIESHTIRKEGQQISFKILSDIPASTYPDGTLVMLWEDEPVSASDRSHMLFIGWHHVDPAAVRGDREGTLKDTTIECLDVAGRLDILPGFPLSVEGKNSPASWLEMYAPNLDKYLDYILRWHSTAYEVADVVLSGTWVNYPFVILGSDAQSLWDQAARRAGSLVPDYVLTCDTKGKIRVKPDPIIQAVADRIATVQAAILESDWSELNWTHQRYPRVHWLRSEAVLASQSVLGALFSVAPDTSPGQGESEQTNGEQLARSQDDLNAAEGNRYARLNARESYFNLVATWDSVKYIEPAALTWVTLTLSTTQAAQRGLTFTSARGIVHEMNVRYQTGNTGMVRSVNLQWERETSGLPATTFTPPETDFPIPYEPPPGDWDTTPPPTLGDGFGSVYVLVDSVLYRTRAFSASSPTWVDIGPAVSDLNDFILDPWNPTSTGFLLGNDGVYRSTDLRTSAPTWDHVIDNAAIQALYSAPSTRTGFTKIVGSINYEGFLAFAGYYIATGGGGVPGGLVLFKSVDNGDTWAGSLIANPAFRSYLGATIDIVPHVVSGELVLYAHHCAAGGNNMYLYRSVDSGATWTQIANKASTGSNAAHLLHCPYEGNEDGMTAYWGQSPANSTPYLFKTVNTTTTNISPSTPASGIGLMKRWGAETYTLDSDIMYHWENNVLRSSTNGGTSWSTVTKSGLPGTLYERASGGFPNNSSQFYLVADTAGNVGVYVSTDGGANWVTKTGDMVQATAVNYRTVIAPLWLAE